MDRPPQVIRCKRLRRDGSGTECGGFVATVGAAWRATVVDFAFRHSDFSDPVHWVAGCRRCRTLHEIRAVPVEPAALLIPEDAR